MNRAVFLDRDGTLIRMSNHRGVVRPPDARDVQCITGVEVALTAIRRMGFEPIVVTNQPDVARGTLASSSVVAVNNAIRKVLPITEFYVCPHDDADNCACRKPAPGLLLQAAKDHDIDLAASYMIGDSWRDIEAGKAAGCTTVWIDNGVGLMPPSPPGLIVRSMVEAADRIHTTERIMRLKWSAT